MIKVRGKSTDPETRDAIENGICVICDKRANIFRSEKFLREYDCIGYCQECQDNILGDSK